MFGMFDTSADGEPTGEPSHGDRDPGAERLELLVAGYVDRLAGGETLDPGEILAEHPDLGERILEYLKSYVGVDAETFAARPLGNIGDYTLRRQIGRGGMGIVYEAWQTSVERRVALKVLPSGVAADARSVSRFVREAKTAAQLRHPSVVPVYGMGVEADTPYYSMELIEGKTLAQILKDIRERAPGWDATFGRTDDVRYFANVAAVFAGVADGLQHAHSLGVVHRDIKPSNLILDRGACAGSNGASGTEATGATEATEATEAGAHFQGRLRILDFGLAHLEGQESLTATGDFVGTPLYMSPEQARRRKIEIDHRTDIYSAGATMYEMLTLRPPFQGKDHRETLSHIVEREPVAPRKVRPRVPAALETIVLKCLRKEPGERYGTAEALAQDLRRFVRGDPVEARPQSRWERLATRLKRHGTRSRLIAALCFVVLLVALAWQSYRTQRAEHLRSVEAFEPAVVAALGKIQAGRFVQEAVAGDTAGVFGFVDEANALSPAPVSADDFDDLYRSQVLGSLEAGAEELRELVANLPARFPRIRDAHYHLARADALLGRLPEAGTALRRALGRDPDFVPARALEWELAGGDPAGLEALRAEYRRRIGWEASWIEAYANVRKRAWPEAAEAYEKLIALRGGEEPYIGCFTEAYLGHGLACLERGDLEAAERDFVRAEDRGAEIGARILLARAYHLDGKKGEAERIFGDLCGEVSPEHGTERILWAAGVYSFLKDYEKGLEWVERLGPEVPIRDRLRSCFLTRLGRTEEAAEAGRTAIERNPKDLRAHLSVAVSLLKDRWRRRGPSSGRRLAELADAARTAAALDPEDPAARGLLATVRGEANREILRLLRRGALRARGMGRGLWAAALGWWAGEAPSAPAGYFDELEHVDTGLDGAKFVGGVSPGELVLYFTYYRGAGRGNPDIYCIARETREGPFLAPATPLDALNTPYEDWVCSGSLSADGERIYITSDRPGGSGSQDIWTARFEVAGDPRGGFRDLRPVEGVNTPAWEVFFHISPDGRRIYFRRGANNLFVASRRGDDEDAPFGDPVLLSSRLDTPWVLSASISTDERTLFWCGHKPPRPGGHGEDDIWMATRPRIFGDRGAPVPFEDVVNPGAPVSTGSADVAPCVTPDWPGPGSGLYVSRYFALTDAEIYRAAWHPDRNGNHLDDIAEIEAGIAEDANGDRIPDECD